VTGVLEQLGIRIAREQHAEAPGQIVRAPVYSDRVAPQAEWTTVLRVAQATKRTAGISPDGGLFYVVLQLDGFRCLYGLKLDRRSGLPIGERFPVVHIHDSAWRLSSTGYGSAVGTDLFVAQIFESRGNIWMSELTRSGS
jgi:hypothetical protein